MAFTDTGRRILLILLALVFIAIAAGAFLAPESMAAGLGYSLQAPNGYSEFFAVYVGLWLATACVAILAACKIRQPLIGDIVAVLVLAQPLGRGIAMLSYGLPTGALFYIFFLELFGGLALLAMRPTK